MLCDWCKAAVELQKLLIVGVVLHIYNLSPWETEAERAWTRPAWWNLCEKTKGRKVLIII